MLGEARESGLRALAVALALAAFLLLQANVRSNVLPSRYRIDGASVAHDPEIVALAQSGLITLDASGDTLANVLAQVSEQAGVLVQSDPGSRLGGHEVKISAVDAPYLAVLCALCVRHGWGLKLYQDGRGGRFFAVTDAEDTPPIVAYDVFGPLAVVWHGLRTDPPADPPSEPAPRPMLHLGLLVDLRANLEVGEGRKDTRSLPVFVGTGRDRRQLLSRHDPQHRVEGSATWQFAPEQFTEARATLTVEIPFAGATATSKVTLPWAEGEHENGVARLLLSRPRSGETKVPVPNEGVFVDAVKWAIGLRLIHVDAVKGTRKKEELVLAVHDVWAVGADGRRFRGEIKTGSGWSGATVGYGYQLEFPVRDPSFRPVSVEIQWAGDYAEYSHNFTLSDLPLR